MKTCSVFSILNHATVQFRRLQSYLSIKISGEVCASGISFCVLVSAIDSMRMYLEAVALKKGVVDGEVLTGSRLRREKWVHFYVREIGQK